MTFQEYLDLLPTSWSTAEKLYYTQAAYYEVVNKLRLYPSLHPIVFDGSCELGGFNHLVTINGSNSVLAFKQIISLPNCTIVTELPDNSSLNTPYTGDLMTIGTLYLGYSEATFNAFNNDWEDLPEIYNIGTRYISTNIDGTTCMYVAGYVYPYFLKSDNPYDTYHCYDIITDYDDYLAYNVSDTLLPLVIMKAKAMYYNDKQDMTKENTLNKATMDTVNIFNKSNELINADSTQTIGLISPVEVT